MSEAKQITDIYFEQNFLIINMSGNQYKIDLQKASNRLYNCSEDDRKEYQISPSGYGIHWPKIDEDLSVNGLLKIATKI